MSNFYETLPSYLKTFFDNNNYKPANVFDANNFLKSFLKLDDLSDIYIKPKKPIIFKGKIMTVVKISSDEPFMACVPQVWYNMLLAQRLKAVIMVFNFYFNKMIHDRSKKPEIHFIPEFNLSVGVLGFSYVPKKYIYIPLERINASNSSFKIFSTIVHELVHFKQANQRQEIYKWLEKNDYDFSKLTSYQKHLLLKYTGHILTIISTYYQNRGEELYKKMLKTSSLTKENIKLWLELEEKKDAQWRILKELTYCLNELEQSAQNKEIKEYNMLVDKYGSKKHSIPHEISLSQSELERIRKAGFDIDDASAQHIANIGYFANLVEMTDEVCFEILNYLLEIFKAKKVEKPFIGNYDELEQQYFEDQRKQLLKQRENKLKQYDGGKINEL